MSQGMLFPRSKAYYRKVLKSRPIAYFPLWETSGAVATDLMKLGNGSYTGVTFNQNGLNLILNPGFETAGAGGADVFSGWSESATDGAIVRTTAAGEFKFGAAACKITAGPTLNTELYDSPTVIPGTTYRISFWTRGDGVNAGRYSLYDLTNGAFIFNITSTGISGAVYTQYSIDFTAPAGCVGVRLRLRCPAVNGGIAYFDDIELFALATSPNGIGDGKNAPFFDGVNDYANIYSAALNAAFTKDESTVALWFKIANAGIWTDGLTRYILRLSAPTATQGQLIFYKHGAANVVYGIRGDSGGAPVFIWNGLQPTTWTHLALTSSVSKGEFRAYWNGVPHATNPLVAAAVIDNSLYSDYAKLGSSHGSPAANVWSGWLAHAALWNRALTPGEIARLARPK